MGPDDASDQCSARGETEPMVLPHPAPRPQPAFCLWKTFSQRISLIREVRQCRNRGKHQRRPNNNSLVIKHSQGPLVPS